MSAVTAAAGSNSVSLPPPSQLMTAGLLSLHEARPAIHITIKYHSIDGTSLPREVVLDSYTGRLQSLNWVQLAAVPQCISACYLHCMDYGV